MCGGQVLIIFVGGAAFQIAKDGQDPALWGIALILGAISIPVGVVIRLIPDWVLLALIPNFLKQRAHKVPGLTVSDEEMDMYPEPLADVRDELNFLRRMKGGRLNNLRFAIAHPKETLIRSRSPSHSRSNSVHASPAPEREDSFGTSRAATPDSRQRSRSNRSRSNSALGAPTVMAGIIAAGVAAGWSPVGRQNPEEGGEPRTTMEGSIGRRSEATDAQNSEARKPE
jgi:Ca2+-transporting ATPase